MSARGEADENPGARNLSRTSAGARLDAAPFRVAGGGARGAFCRDQRALPASHDALRLAVIALALMMAAPLITLAGLMRQKDPAVGYGAPGASALAVKPVEGVSVAAGPGAPAPEAPAPQPAGILWCVEAWFLGVLLLSLRTAGGLFLVEKMRRCEMRPVARELYEKCLALQRKMGLERVIRYCECLRLDAPAVLGWVRPVVLLPAKALTGLSE